MCNCVATETSVQTCPECLPAGAITWLIENGRQLDIFEGPPELIQSPGVLAFSEGDDSYDHYEQDPSEILSEIRSVDPSF